MLVVIYIGEVANERGSLILPLPNTFVFHIQLIIVLQAVNNSSVPLLIIGQYFYSEICIWTLIKTICKHFKILVSYISIFKSISRHLDLRAILVPSFQVNKVRKKEREGEFHLKWKRFYTWKSFPFLKNNNYNSKEIKSM